MDEPEIETAEPTTGDRDAVMSAANAVCPPGQFVQDALLLVAHSKMTEEDGPPHVHYSMVTGVPMSDYALRGFVDTCHDMMADFLGW